VTLSPTLLLDVVVGGFTTGGIYALVALGLNLQYGLMRVLNVAHGEFLMLGAYVTFSLHTGWGVNPLLTLLITGPTAFAVGLVLHRLLYAPLVTGEAVESLESRSLLLSFGLMFVLQNAALLIWSADLKGYSYLAIPLRWLGTVFPANRVLAAAIALALGVAFYLYLRYSLTGKAVRALKAGQVQFRVDRAGIVHGPFGKASFDEARLLENATAFYDAIMRAKPAAARRGL